MRRYWDTSALIECLESESTRALSLEPDQWTRSHSLAEMFSTLTKERKFSVRLTSGDAVLAIRDVTAGMKFVDLKPEEVFAALGMAQTKGVRGGSVHDWLHAVAAKKAKVEMLFTLKINVNAIPDDIPDELSGSYPQ